MPQGYGFLKYGRPMAAATPLLLALSALPSTAHACTGSANDPIFCSQVNGQFVTGVGAFIDNNLSGVPGSSPIPGSTAPLDDDFDSGDFLSPNDDDNDLDSVFVGEDEFTESGFIQTPLVYGWENQETFQAFDEGFNVTNTTTSAGSPITTFPISGVPQFQGTGAPAPIVGAATQFYGVTPTNYGQDRFQLAVVPGTDRLAVVAPDGTVPPAIQTLVDQSEGTSSGSGGCVINVPACQAQVGNFFISVSSVMPSENVAPVLNALVNGPPATAPLNTGGSVVIGPDGNPTDTAGLRAHYRVDLPASSGTSGSSGTSNDAAGDAFVTRQVASVNKLRDEAANAPDPETRRQKQAELQRKESAIRRYGSAAVQNALGLGDASSAPVPGRN